MTLIECPECDNTISERAIACPHCGYSKGGIFFGYEYKSQRTLFGMPLVHLVYGPPLDPMTGRIRIAKGIIAIGPLAFGIFAMGGLALGLVAFGGVGLGLLIAFGGVGLSLGLAVGGLAIGSIAIGGCAVGYYAIGGGAFGVHALGENAKDPQLQEFFRNLTSQGG